MIPAVTAPSPRARTRGFSMIEIAIAMAILSILVAIAVVSFSAFQSSSADLSAEVNLTRAFSAQRLYYAGGAQVYTTSPLDRPPEGVSLVVTASTALNVISVATANLDQDLGLAVLADNGDCWYLAANTAGDYVTGVLLPGTCTASRALVFTP